MSRTANKIKKEGKIITPEIESIAEDVDKYHDLAVMAESAGGKIVRANLVKDIISSVDFIANKFKKLSHIELITECAELKSSLDLLRVMTRAKKNELDAQNALKDALTE